MSCYTAHTYSNQPVGTNFLLQSLAAELTSRKVKANKLCQPEAYKQSKDPAII